MLHFSGCQQCSTEFLLPRPEKEKTAGRHNTITGSSTNPFPLLSILSPQTSGRTGPPGEEQVSGSRDEVRLVQDMLDPEDHRAKLRSWGPEDNKAAVLLCHRNCSRYHRHQSRDMLDPEDHRAKLRRTGVLRITRSRNGAPMSPGLLPLPPPSEPDMLDPKDHRANSALGS